ncbi:hypothetical protein Tco_1185029 [Tanacetum coccineum]
MLASDEYKPLNLLRCGKKSARVGANDPITGVDDGTESTGDLYLLRDGPAECEDECSGLSDESHDDDSDVVGGNVVDDMPRCLSAMVKVHSLPLAVTTYVAFVMGAVGRPKRVGGEMCSGEDISSGESESEPV